MAEENERIYNIVLCGPPGVGKTSTLATMYEQISQLSSVNLRVGDTETQTTIQGRLSELKNVKDTLFAGEVGALLEGTKDKRAFYFKLPYLKFSFTDYPGGWLDMPNKFDEIINDIKESNILIIAIDSVYLMEDKNLHEKYNQPLNIKHLIDEVLETKEKFLIIFVLVKSETYQNPIDGNFNKLIEAFQETYHMSLQHIKQAENVVSLLIPVLTLGCVKFNSFKKLATGEKQPVFVKTPGKSYDPKYADIVLKSSVRFLIKLRRGGFLQRIWDDYFKKIPIGKHLEVLSDECDLGYPVKIYGNKNLLE